MAPSVSRVLSLKEMTNKSSKKDSFKPKRRDASLNVVGSDLALGRTAIDHSIEITFKKLKLKYCSCFLCFSTLICIM